MAHQFGPWVLQNCTFVRSFVHRRSTQSKMNFRRLFVVLMVLVALLMVGVPPVDGAPRRWRLGKRLERLGQNLFRAAQKALPVIAGYKALGLLG
ncbi:hypothetical protein ZHAS_00009499 [Anopheles sinensis]|uniref:Uncharacterized protein n=1 Tax=Anopheles sinensis TaxID=74873 RepID=A0A084VVE2_ANOSI|nr:hypothetical protein ZHAS_00009499 [Anopheles sinensis]